MYRIVKESNKLTGKTLYFIERKWRFLFWSSWTRDLDILGVDGPVGAPTLSGAKEKLRIIKDHIGYKGSVVMTNAVTLQDDPDAYDNWYNER